MKFEEMMGLVIKFGMAEQTMGMALEKSPFDQETYSKQKAEAHAIFEKISNALYELTKEA